MANFLLAVKWLTETDVSRTSGLAIKMRVRICKGLMKGGCSINYSLFVVFKVMISCSLLASDNSQRFRETCFAFALTPQQVQQISSSMWVWPKIQRLNLEGGKKSSNTKPSSPHINLAHSTSFILKCDLQQHKCMQSVSEYSCGECFSPLHVGWWRRKGWGTK